MNEEHKLSLDYDKHISGSFTPKGLVVPVLLMSAVVYMVNETNIFRFGNRVEHMDTYINTD